MNNYHEIEETLSVYKYTPFIIVIFVVVLVAIIAGSLFENSIVNESSKYEEFSQHFTNRVIFGENRILPKMIEHLYTEQSNYEIMIVRDFLTNHNCDIEYYITKYNSIGLDAAPHHLIKTYQLNIIIENEYFGNFVHSKHIWLKSVGLNKDHKLYKKVNEMLYI